MLPFDPPLYVVTDRSRFAAPPADDVFADAEWRALAAIVAARPGAVQLREKDLSGRALWTRAKRLAALCRDAGVKCLVNDRVDVALAADADGVHLPGGGMLPQDARVLVGPGRLVGRSVHDARELDGIRDADFVVFGPVYETPSKRAYGPPQGLERLAAICTASVLPVLAIGGITAERVREVRSAGAAGVAVVGAVLDSRDPGGMVRRLVDALV